MKIGQAIGYFLIFIGIFLCIYSLTSYHNKIEKENIDDKIVVDSIVVDSIVYQNIWLHGAWYGSKNTYNLITTGKGIDQDSAFADDYNNFKNRKYD